MLQLVGGADPTTGEVDLVTSVLLPDDEVRVAFTDRKDVRLLRSFWAWRPTSPVIIDCGQGRFEHVLCGVPGEAWTQGPLSAQRVRDLRRTGRERLDVYLPAAVFPDDPKSHGSWQERVRELEASRDRRGRPEPGGPV